MEDMIHGRPSLSRSETGRGSVAGSIAIVSMFAGGLVAVSYPLLTAALAAGIVAGYFAHRVVPAVRRRIRGAIPTREPTGGSGVGTTSSPK